MVVTLNLNNWAFYYIKIGEMSQTSEEYRRRSKTDAMFKKVINFLTFVVMSVIFAYMCYLITIGVKYNETRKEQLFLIAGIGLVIGGNIFLVMGILINFRIKDYFWDFYDENVKMLWAATLALSLPITTRGSIDLAREFNLDFDKWIRKNSMFYTPTFYILGDIFPLCFQVSSLVFGFIRYRKNQALRKQELLDE